MAQSAAERMKQYRKRMRSANLREVRLLVPDLRSSRFRAELRRQSLLLRRSVAAQREMDFVEALQADNADIWSE
jgi:hypothetical protein